MELRQSGMELPRSQRSGERNGAERRFRVGVRHHFLGQDAVLLCQQFAKRDGLMPGRSRGRCGTLPARMGSAVQRRREGKAFPLKISYPMTLPVDLVVAKLIPLAPSI